MLGLTLVRRGPRDVMPLLDRGGRERDNTLTCLRRGTVISILLRYCRPCVLAFLAAVVCMCALTRFVAPVRLSL